MQEQFRTLKFSPSLPCTTAGCPNEATVGSATYDAKSNAWLIFPLCKECTEKLLAKYSDGDEQTKRQREFWTEDLPALEQIAELKRQAQEPAMRYCEHCQAYHPIKYADWFCPLDPKK